MTIDRKDITGLVLAGGRGSRMGGVDKGLQDYQGRPMAAHAIERLQPQVGALLVNANRHLADYAAFGAPVLPDALPDYPGPLAGMLAGLQACQTRYLVTVPCDTPHFPPDLVARLGAALHAQQAPLAMAATPDAEGRMRGEPVFLLIDTRLRDSLAAFLASGERKIDRWTASHACVQVPFPDPQAFFNVNTLGDLGHLQGRAAVEVAREFWQLMAGNDFAAVGAVLAEDFVLDWPQSGERIRGAARFAQMNREYPAHGPWRFQVHRLFGDAGQAASDVTVTDGVHSARALTFFRVERGRIARIVEYWPEPYAAPAWRAHLTEPIE